MANVESKYEIRSFQFNTVFRNSSSTLSSPSFIVPQTFTAKAFKVKNCLIPLSIYSIGTRNNKIYFREQSSDATLRTASLTNGYYNSSNILTEIKSKLDSTGTQSYTVVYSELTNKITITASANFKFESGNSHCLYELGLESNTSYSTSQLAVNQLDLSGLKAISIVSNIDGIKIVNNQFKVLTSIFLEEDSLAISTYEDNSADYISINQNINELTFRLVDERNREITVDKDFVLTINFLVE